VVTSSVWTFEGLGLDRRADPTKPLVDDAQRVVVPTLEQRG